MKNTLLCCMILLSVSCVAQNATTKQMIAEIDGKWIVDENDNITCQRIVQLPNIIKEEIYSRALNYFVYNYNDANSVIKTKDKALGQIVCKGLYPSILGNGWTTTPTDCFHIVRIDIKEGKARITITLTDYKQFFSANNSTTVHKVSDEYPIKTNRYQNNMYGKAFYYAFKRAETSINDIENALKNGNTANALENDDW